MAGIWDKSFDIAIVKMAIFVLISLYMLYLLVITVTGNNFEVHYIEHMRDPSSVVNVKWDYCTFLFSIWICLWSGLILKRFKFSHYMLMTIAVLSVIISFFVINMEIIQAVFLWLIIYLLGRWLNRYVKPRSYKNSVIDRFMRRKNATMYFPIELGQKD